MPVGVIIHELTHYYLDNNSYDTKAIIENFIKQYGRNALTGYADGHLDDATDDRFIEHNRNRGFTINDVYFKERYDEVVCEIVATYGRRGQFDKIRELFNI